ncbi:MAG: hypothetical protein HC824_19900 [Synechococcales cyanobacterium RM1_1_8]|nr:hypothetical protein [Synechococcales cyanobacterium RM1_1_8]
MSLSIPHNSQEIFALRQGSISTEVVARAIAGVIQVARAEGKSLADLTAELLSEDGLLSPEDRLWLSDIVASHWHRF